MLLNSEPTLYPNIILKNKFVCICVQCVYICLWVQVRVWCVHRGQKKALRVSFPVNLYLFSLRQDQSLNPRIWAFPARLAANKPNSFTVPTLLAAGVKCITRNPTCFVDAGIRISVLIRQQVLLIAELQLHFLKYLFCWLDFSFFETGSHLVGQTSLELTMQATCLDF